MRFRLALAFSVSILLIGAASWIRFATVKYAQQPGIFAVKQAQVGGGDYEVILKSFNEPSGLSATTTSKTETLTNTDVLGRQLILDYVDLASKGGATESGITALANRYVDNIPNLNRVAELKFSDIHTVPDNKPNFQNYEDGLTKIYKEYAAKIEKIKEMGSSFDTLNPAFYSTVQNLSTAYANAAAKLKNLAVPTSLVTAHLELVNSYLSSAAASKAISETEKDSASAFAGVITLNANVVKEKELLDEIGHILTSNGV